MSETLWTNEDARSFLNLGSAEGAVKLLRKWGVRPVHFGPGRGLGLRWIKDEVVSAALSKQEPDNAGKKEPKKVKRKKSGKDIFDMSGKEALRLVQTQPRRKQ